MGIYQNKIGAGGRRGAAAPYKIDLLNPNKNITTIYHNPVIPVI